MHQPLNNEVKTVQSFNNYIKNKEHFVESTASDVGKSALGDVSLGEKHKEQLGKLFQVIEIIASDFKSELISFLNRMSDKDERIEKLVEEMHEDGWASLGQAGQKAASSLSSDDAVRPGEEVGPGGEEQIADFEEG